MPAPRWDAAAQIAAADALAATVDDGTLDAVHIVPSVFDERLVSHRPVWPSERLLRPFLFVGSGPVGNIDTACEGAKVSVGSADAAVA
jgi:hypothetical protein